MIENFEFNDIVLYSKGWLEHKGNTMIEDLSYLFGLKYGYRPKTEEEIAMLMLRVFDSVKEKLGNFDIVCQYHIFENEVRNKMRIMDVSRDMSIILVVRSVLQNLKRNEITLNKPHYGKHEYFRMGSLFGDNPISMTYAEMNRRAKKIFG